MRKSQRPDPARFSQPIRQIVTMLFVLSLMVFGAWLLLGTISAIILTNPYLNGLIMAVFFLGVGACFWQVFTLAKSVSWIERFARNAPGAINTVPPTLLAPLAQLLKTRSATHAQITSSSARSILDSVSARIDEARDFTQYLTNTLVFLGLLGTFFGLATTVPAVVDTIRALAPAEGESGVDIFGRLLGGLESQLGGMGTAFSSSLLGLAGSMAIGLLELFAGHGQSRFYRELEDWLSTITRIGIATDGADSDDGSSAVVQMMDQLSGQIDVLQEMYAQGEANRAAGEESIQRLTVAVDALGARLESMNALPLMERLVDGQDRLISVIKEAGAGGIDSESRMRLRSIDVQLLRMFEEISAGRQEGIAELKSEVANVSATLRQISRRS